MRGLNAPSLLAHVVNIRMAKLPGKKWTEAQDKAYDQAHGIKEGSKTDNRLDKKRGVPIRKAGKG